MKEQIKIGYWPNIDNGVTEARKIIKKHRFKTLPAAKVLQDLGYSALCGAIARYYGGFHNFRKHLGEPPQRLEQGTLKNLEYCVHQSREIMQKHDFKRLPRHEVLIKLGYSSLINAIHSYHGGFYNFRKILGEEEKRRKLGTWKDHSYGLQQAQKVIAEHGLSSLPNDEKLREMGYGALAKAITVHYGGFREFRALLGEVQKRRIRSTKGIQQFLNKNQLAKSIAFLAAGGYVGDATQILLKLWPDRFPSAVELARSLPGAIQRIGYSMIPFKFSSCEKIYEELPSITPEVKQNIEDLLYRVMRDQYQQPFNKNPQGTLQEIKSFADEGKIQSLAERVLDYYESVYEFEIPGFGMMGCSGK